MHNNFPPAGMDKFGTPPMMDTSHIKRKWLDVPYAHQSPTQKLDIYLPEEGRGPFPVVFVIHGGAWSIGDKGDVQNLPMLKAIERGYAVVSINYRLSHEAIFPTQIYDCKSALRFVKANAEKYLLDKTKIAAWGGSAGGHLSALLGTSPGISSLEDLSTGNLNKDTHIQAVVDWYGPTQDFLKMDEQLIETGNGEPDHSQEESPESRLLGRKITEVPELVKFASPMTYITPEVPYFLIQHGYQDQLVPVQQSINFAEQLEKIAGRQKVILEIFKNNVHHADPFFETNANVNRVLDFLDQHLNP
jgi:acetyl esterase/lipase